LIMEKIYNKQWNENKKEWVARIELSDIMG